MQTLIRNLLKIQIILLILHNLTLLPHIMIRFFYMSDVCNQEFARR